MIVWNVLAGFAIVIIAGLGLYWDHKKTYAKKMQEEGLTSDPPEEDVGLADFGFNRFEGDTQGLSEEAYRAMYEDQPLDMPLWMKILIWTCLVYVVGYMGLVYTIDFEGLLVFYGSAIIVALYTLGVQKYIAPLNFGWVYLPFASIALIVVLLYASEYWIIYLPGSVILGAMGGLFGAQTRQTKHPFLAFILELILLVTLVWSGNDILGTRTHTNPVQRLAVQSIESTYDLTSYDSYIKMPSFPSRFEPIQFRILISDQPLNGGYQKGRSFYGTYVDGKIVDLEESN